MRDSADWHYQIGPFPGCLAEFGLFAEELNRKPHAVAVRNGRGTRKRFEVHQARPTVRAMSKRPKKKSAATWSRIGWTMRHAVGLILETYVKWLYPLAYVRSTKSRIVRLR